MRSFHFRISFVVRRNVSRADRAGGRGGAGEERISGQAELVDDNNDVAVTMRTQKNLSLASALDTNEK